MPATASEGRGKVDLKEVTFYLFTTRPTGNGDGSGTSYTGYISTFQDSGYDDKSGTAEFGPAGGLPTRRIFTNPDWSYTFKGIQGGDTPALMQAIVNAKAANYGKVWLRAIWRIGSGAANIVTGVYTDGKLELADINSESLTIQCDGILPQIS